jgi:alkylation response protein AidB-like acyl-CoA dehydrogenase
MSSPEDFASLSQEELLGLVVQLQRKVQELVSEMDTELLSAQNALQSMIELAGTDYEPDLYNSSLTYQRKALAGRGAVRAVEKAMEVVGGSSFFRSLGLERCFRDVQKEAQPLEEVESRLNGTTLLQVTDTGACIGVSNPFAVAWLERKMYRQIAKAIKGVLGKDLDLQFVTGT